MGLKGISQYALNVVKENYGIAAPPGVPFVGGSHLVVWKSSKKLELARKLVEYLAYGNIQRGFYKTAFMFPTRNDVLRSDLETGDEIWKAGVQALYRGRCFPSVRLWGKLEEAVSTELGNIWSEIAANPRRDADQIVVKYIVALAKRLKIIFGG